MKKNNMLQLLLFWSLILLFTSFASTSSALGYWEQHDLGVVDMQYEEDDLPVLYGTLNARMATRTGPGTQYDEPGTFYKIGDRIRIISLAYDDNKLPWVQVEVKDWKGNIFRAYTGLKRFNDISEVEIPVEIPSLWATVIREATLYHGPGRDYKTYSWTLSPNRPVQGIAIENDFVLCNYDSVSGQAYHFWIHSNDLSFE